MLFNSFNFWVVFPFIFGLYWFIPHKFAGLKKWFLILVSYLLYMNWKPVYALILLFVTVVTYVGGLVFENRTQNGKRKILITCFVLLGAAPLLIFKYYNFINESLSTALQWMGLRFEFPGLNYMVPIGISFFTFQALGYMWDVYYGKIKAERNWSDYLLFVSFFPQIAAGPISKSDSLLPQIKQFKAFDYAQGVSGLKLLLWGMFLKVVLADRLGIYVDTVYANYEHFSGLNCLIASIMYSLQIYGDFCGYSLMAIGIAKMLGFDLINNFERPYFATSITNFWKRWHISLTKWLTTYIYIPLGGSRCSKVRTYWNIMVTFLVSGIWHGANWTFVIWGLIHGVLQVIEKQFKLMNLGLDKMWSRVLKMGVTFMLVNFAWVFFRMPTFTDALRFIGRIFTNFKGAALSGAGNSDLLLMFTGIIVVLLKEGNEEFNIVRCKKWLQWILCLMIFIMILCVGVLDSGQFIYVNF